jgi:hypothetical protein
LSVLIRVKQSDLAMLQVVVGLLVGEKELSEVSSEMREIALSRTLLLPAFFLPPH